MDRGIPAASVRGSSLSSDLTLDADDSYVLVPELMAQVRAVGAHTCAVPPSLDSKAPNRGCCQGSGKMLPSKPRRCEARFR
jgi:hypothetical protein